MIEEPENPILVMLRRLDSKFDRMTEEMREMKGRLTNVEIVISALVTADGRMQHAIDRMSDRLDRIERRLDVTTRRAAAVARIGLSYVPGVCPSDDPGHGAFRCFYPPASAFFRATAPGSPNACASTS
jgi:hypothetical protein